MSLLHRIGTLGRSRGFLGVQHLLGAEMMGLGEGGV